MSWSDALGRGIGAAYRQLFIEAAQGGRGVSGLVAERTREWIQNDDTWMRVLELTVRINNGEPLREDQPQRRGVFTTGILSVSGASCGLPSTVRSHHTPSLG